MKTLSKKVKTSLLIFSVGFVLVSAFSVLAKDQVAGVFGMKTPVKVGKSYKRESLRAFYTAPPVIPHKVGTLAHSRECLTCHQNNRDLGERTSVKTPHPQFSNCLQCHVQSAHTSKDGYKPVKNSFVGMKSPGKGTRAHAVAPPMIPHRKFLRENCTSCHSKDNPNVKLRTPHADRSSCTQCHLFDKSKQF